jgi:hypothetical protein
MVDGAHHDEGHQKQKLHEKTVFVIDSIVSTEHSILKAREIFETLLFAISLDFGHFIHLHFRHAIEVFRCHKSHMWNAWKDCKFCKV